MEPIEQLAYILPTLSSVVDRIDAAQLYRKTSNTSSTVHDVLDEMILVGDACAHWFRGELAPERPAPPVYGRVPAAEYRAVMDDLLAAVKVPGAMERMLSIPGGPMPATTLGRVVALNGVIHGWDIASTTGLRFEVPPTVIAAADDFARRWRVVDGIELDATGSVDPGADVNHLECLVATSGRSA
ncbi:MAG: hypothetical protein ACSLFO_00370 [Acidimicrobiales bacterium]